MQHAQITTPAQAAEATPIGAKKAKRAALTVVQPGETPVQAAIRVAQTYRREVMDQLGKAHTATEEAGVAAQRALDAVPFPAQLVVPRRTKMTDDPLTWVVAMTFRHPDGREIVREINDDRTERLETREAIVAYFGEDHPELSARLAIFDQWEAETASLRKALDAAIAKEARADLAFQRSYRKNDELCRAILRTPAEPHEAATQVEAYARLLSSCNGKNTKLAQITFDEDAAPVIEFMHSALKALCGKGTAGPRAAWTAAVTAVDETEAAFLAASQAQDVFEDANPEIGDRSNHPEYEHLKSEWARTNSEHFAALRRMIQTPAPDAAALARQIQAFAWLEVITEHEFGGISGYPLDPADPVIVTAVETDGDNQERGLLALYRSARALGGGPEPSIIASDRPSTWLTLIAAE